MRKNVCALITATWAGPAILIAIVAWPLLAQAPANLPGTIAYFRVVGATESEPGTSELHLVQPDGSNDRMIYSTPRGLVSVYPVPGWRPDGQEIAFISAHEVACSRFDSDIFAIQPNGSGLRRITNAPKCDELAQLPKGAVTVTVENLITNTSIFFVYVEGATDLVQVTISPGFSATVTVGNVADLNRQQIVYVKSGSGTWFNPAAYADVVPGQTVTATNPVQITSGFGPYQLRINNLTWKGDGSEIAYIVEAGLRQFVPAFPVAGEFGQDVFAGNQASVSTALAWSPRGDEFLYYSILTFPNGIYRGAKGSDVSTHTLVLETDFVDGITWLSDGSGFVFSINYSLGLSPNKIGLFDFSNNQATLINEGSNIAGVVPAPDGNFVAFAQREDENSPFDLWGMTLDGSQQWKIANDIVSWDWGPEMATGVKEKDGSFGRVKDFELLPNYPNPFNPSTNIRYSLPVAAHVTLKVFDVLGHEIATLVNKNQKAGGHTVTFDTQLHSQELTSGIYFYKLAATTNGSNLFAATGKMLLAR
jgi:hypothetical protein